MKKLFIPTAFAVLLTTGLVAQEAPKVEEKTAAAPAAASTAAPVAEKAAAPAADKAKTADAKADKAHAAPAKAHTAAKKGEHHAAAHHSNVDRKLANELTDKLNAMTCPFAVPAATTVAPAPAADKAHVAAPAA
jgi:hypothetical protein